MSMKMSNVVFWIVTFCGLVLTNVLEEHMVSIFIHGATFNKTTIDISGVEYIIIFVHLKSADKTVNTLSIRTTLVELLPLSVYLFMTYSRWLHE